LNTDFLINTKAPSLNSTVATLTIVLALGTSSSREDLNQFITAINFFYPALKYTLEISDTSLAFLDIEVSIEGN